MNERDESTTPCCLGCGYNLTGLTEQRCPECGEAFSWETLRSEARGRPKLIGPYAVVLGLIAPPVIVWPSLLLFGWLGWEWIYIPIVLFFIGYSLVNSVELCQRISTTIDGGNPVLRGLGFRYCLLGFGFIALQWGIAIGIPLLFFL